MVTRQIQVHLVRCKDIVDMRPALCALLNVLLRGLRILVVEPLLLRLRLYDQKVNTAKTSLSAR